MTQGAKSPSLLIAALMTPQVNTKTHKETALFPVDCLCTILRHKIKRKVNMRKPYSHLGSKEVCSYNHPNPGKDLQAYFNYAR